MAVKLSVPMALERLGALPVVRSGKWMFVPQGYAWLISAPVLVVDGVLRLDGVVKVG